MSAICPSCPRACHLPLDALGACHGRREFEEGPRAGVAPENYGRVTALALDPIEKKPLARFHPGTFVVSVGSYGCNMRCPWCQNHGIAQAGADAQQWSYVSPEQLVELTLEQQRANPLVSGIAYTYNEPLVGWEYVRDTAELAHAHGLLNVLVSNGCFNMGVMKAVGPHLDAANIDLKSMSEKTYGSLGGDLSTVLDTIEYLARETDCHVELTCLIVPGVNDSDEEMDAMAKWIASVDPEIPLHVSRFFPQWRMQDRGPTPVAGVYHLASVARRHLQHVYTGNC